MVSESVRNLTQVIILECGGLNAKEVCYKSRGICVSHDRNVDVARTVGGEFEVETKSLRSDLMARRRFSDSPLILKWGAFVTYVPEQHGLVLPNPSHGPPAKRCVVVEGSSLEWCLYSLLHKCVRPSLCICCQT